MKTLIKFILVAVLGGAFSAAAVAGPGPQFWNRPAAKPAASMPVQETPAPPPSLTCARMLVPNPGFSKGPQYRSVACTPEMMKNDWRCQQACANAKKG
ncbi:MAG TPA: hypothetical protein VG838_06840 [Opitutaceae bacterium]|nr:hypothetical protein [Lacunisphaera sp.]HWA09147.1 hypothetical protein [Opitutaceae bacterium]